jgi:electron transfer flavoprotein alpha subunit
MPRVFAYIAHRGGVPDDSAGELATAASRIDPGQPCVAVVTGWGADLDAVCEHLRATFVEVWKVAAESLAYPNAEVVRKALIAVVPAGSIVLVAHGHFGVDLSPGLAIRMDVPYLPDVVEVNGLAGGEVTAVRQEFGGQVSTHVRCRIDGGAVVNVRPGAFRAADGGVANGTVVEKAVDGALLTSRRRHLETIAAEAGDVDITKEAVLVSVGRGIGEADNVELAQELAEALGGAVSCSRPVVDAKWLDKSRQVGSSGKTVRPKVYLACGISGSFQHMAGIKGSPFLVAINKNLKAPIFRAADVGVVDDVLEFLPALTARVLEETCAPGKGRKA